MSPSEKSRKRRSLARRLRESFTQADGERMFDSVRKPSGRLRDGSGFEAGRLVPKAGHDGLSEVSFDEIRGSVASAEDCLLFIMGAGPRTPEAIARRAAVVASIVLASQIGAKRAAKLAGCHPASLSRLRKKAKRYLGASA